MIQDIAASIVAHRTNPDELRRVIECLLRSPRIASVHVVDNSPTNQLHSVVSAINPRRVTYSHVDNRGYGAGHNIAIRQSLSNPTLRYHLVLNADVWWEGDVVTSLAEMLDTNPTVGLAMPKVYYPNGDLQLTPRRVPTPFDLIFKRFLPPFISRPLVNRYLLAHANHNVTINAPYLLGSFMFLRLNALQEVGLFDERFFMYPEDIDLSRRIHRHWLTLHYPKVSIVHAHAAASRTNHRMLRIHITNMIKYFNKWGWIFDSERRRFNRQLTASLTPLTTPPPPQRG